MVERSYKNNKGETVTVSEEHLETAVDIKLELQKASPSRRCSWSLHKKLMEKEGFYDSDINEAYRCMLKAYQKAIGELPTAPTHADMIADNKLKSIRELVGEIAWEKRENQAVLRELNKVKRDVIDNGLMIDEVTNAIRDVLSKVDWSDISKPRPVSQILRFEDTRMIALISDWHIGGLVDLEENEFNYNIAVKRVNEYVDKVIEIALENSVSTIDVVFLGDMLEHLYMRFSQGYNVEFPVSQQIALSGSLLIDMLVKLSNRFNINYQGFSGNHDRINGDKKANVSGDSGMFAVNQMVKMVIENINRDNLKFIECEPYSASILDCNGKNFKFLHGDLLRISDSRKLADYSNRDGVIYDAIVYGHLHHYMAQEIGLGKWEIRCGSLKGLDSYCKEKGFGSSPSQAVILVTESGEIKPQQVLLH